MVRETLLPDTQPLDDTLVALEVRALEVVEQSPPLSHQLQQSATGVVVLGVHLEVLRQGADPLGQERHLDFR